MGTAGDEEDVKYTLPSEMDLSSDDVEDAAYMKLRSEYEKNLNRVVKVHSLRMDNLKKAREEKEECYRKQLERHNKDMADFEKKVRTAEKEQIKRLKQLEEDWRQIRAEYRGKRQHGKPGLASTSGSDTVLTAAPALGGLEGQAPDSRGSGIALDCGAPAHAMERLSLHSSTSNASGSFVS